MGWDELKPRLPHSHFSLGWPEPIQIWVKVKSNDDKGSQIQVQDLGNLSQPDLVLQMLDYISYAIKGSKV